MTDEIRFDDGAAYERYMGTWSQLAGASGLDTRRDLGTAAGRTTVLCGAHHRWSQSERHQRLCAEKGEGAGMGIPMKTFDNEWILEAFEGHATFFTKRMFGGLAAYLFDRQMLVLVEPTKTGRWNWHGVLVCTDHAHHSALMKEFPSLAPHAILRKWLYLDSRHDDFEPTMERVARAIARDDPRFGIHPRPRKRPRQRRGA